MSKKSASVSPSTTRRIEKNSVTIVTAASSCVGHPVQTMVEENRLAKQKARALKAAAWACAWGFGDREAARAALENLTPIVIHLEVSQDLTEPLALQGQRRLLDLK